MSPELSPDITLEIGHVLFIDIVGYSKLLIEEQKERLGQLTKLVLATAQVRESPDEQLVRLPTGDGMALVFRHSVAEPARCALEIAEALRKHPEIPVRMGIHSGPVSEVSDVSGRKNIAGAGINMAQRVMDCGDAGHILVSQHVADDLMQYRQWAPRLRDLGECQVKHGVRLRLVNLYAEPLGNPEPPEKFRSAVASVPTPLSVIKPKHVPWRELLIAAALLALLIAAGVFMFRQRATSRTSSAPVSTAAPIVPERSIAVLPFENLSEEKANAYFTEGIQDEILTRLAKIGALKVISRTSTARYASIPQNLPEIAHQLGVANVLEGSVQKIGNQARINVQLIRAATDEHMWAETYNRNLDDVFGVEGEVAGAIAGQLNATLSGSEKQELAAKPTNNAEAYDAYLRGLAFSERAEGLESDGRSAVQAFETAVGLDPNFALAWARLAREHCYFLFNSDNSPARRDAARKSLDSAMRLQPGLLETQLAEAYHYYLAERDYDRARNIFEQIRVRSPNNSEAARALALISRRQGRWDESLRRFDEAIELDPRNLQTLTWASDTYTAMRQFPGALKLLDRILDIAPANSTAIGSKAGVYQAMGELDEADAVLVKVGLDASNVQLVSALTGQLLYRHQYPAAIELLQSYLAKKDAAQGFDRAFALFGLGELQRFSGDAASAKVSYSDCRGVLEPALSAQPDNAQLVSIIARIDSGLGDEEMAVKEAERAIQLLPAAKDAFVGPGLEEAMAQVLARFGKKDRAIAALQHLATTPYGRVPITHAFLRLDPTWDSLRGDPRFEKLCEQK